MADAHRALPTFPLALLAGAAIVFHTAQTGLDPRVAVVVGAAGGVVLWRLLYSAAEGWSARARRVVGYASSVLVGLGLAAIFVFAAFATSLCGLWGETCTAGEEAAIDRYVLAALVSAGGTPVLYAVLDAVTLWRDRR